MLLLLKRKASGLYKFTEDKCEIQNKTQTEAYYLKNHRAFLNKNFSYIHITKKQAGAKVDIANFKICSLVKDIIILTLHKEGKMVKNTLLCLFLVPVKDLKIAVFIENKQPPVKSSLLNPDQR